MTVRRKPLLAPLKVIPKCDSAKLFIWDAVEIVGKALHPDWSGNELSSVDWRISPVDAQRADDARKPIPITFPSRSIVRYQPAPANPKISKIPAEHVQAYRLHQAQERRKAQLPEEQKLWQDNHNAVQRLTSACEWLAQACRDKRVSSFIRQREGAGDLRPMPLGDWNVDDALAQMVSQGGYDHWLTKVAVPRKLPVYVFIDKESLMAAVSPLPGNSLTLSDHDFSSLPPCLKMAITIALHDPLISGKGKKVRESAAREAWNLAYPIVESGTFIEAIAMVLNIPDIPKIKAEKERAKEKRLKNLTP